MVIVSTTKTQTTDTQRTYKIEYFPLRWKGLDGEYTAEEIAEAVRKGYDYDRMPDEAKPEVEETLRKSGDWEKMDRNNPSIRKYDLGERKLTAKNIVAAIRYGGLDWNNVPDEAKPEVEKVMKECHLWDSYRK